MEGTCKDTSTLVDIHSCFDQYESCRVILFPDGQAKRRALVFVKLVGVDLGVFQDSVDDPDVAGDSGLVKQGSLTVVLLVLVESIFVEVFEKGEEGAFIHLVLDEQREQLVQRLKVAASILGQLADCPLNRRLCVVEPLQAELLEHAHFMDGAGQS